LPAASLPRILVEKGHVCQDAWPAKVFVADAISAASLGLEDSSQRNFAFYIPCKYHALRWCQNEAKTLFGSPGKQIEKSMSG
jgi:hypothetical protein